MTYPNPQPGNPIVTYSTPTNGARAYGTLIKVGSRYAGVRAAVKAGNGHAYITAMGKSGYGTSTACMLSAYHPPAPAPKPPTEVPLQSFNVLPGPTGSLVVKGDGHSYLRLKDNTLHPVPGGWPKDWAQPVKLLVPIPGGAPGADRSTGYLIGVEAAFLLASDVTFTPKP